MEILLKTLVNLPRPQKRLVTLLIDLTFIASAFWLSFMLSLDSFAPLYMPTNWLLLLVVLPATLFSFIKLGLYRAVLRYINSQALWAIISGTLVATFSLLISSVLFGITLPLVMPVLFSCFCLLSVGGSRITVRAFILRIQENNKEAVIIYGAGAAGRQLATALHNGPEYYVAAFVDDDRSKLGSVIQGVDVIAREQINNLIENIEVKKLLLALPSSSRSRRKEILNSLEMLPLHIFTIPGMADIVNGSAKLDDIKEVDIDDLLGRDAVLPNPELMAADITSKVVMVSGAGGSIGSELCRQIIKLNPKQLILFELSEFALYSIDKELNQYNKKHSFNVEILPILGSIQHENGIKEVLTAFSVQTVYHAAAFKHVPLVEHNVIEGVRNNVFGTLFMAQAAIDSNVETFVLISTDKAVRPTNVMGTTKRLAELVLQALAKKQSNTRFCMVRFGNVLGSSGSVVPLFRKQIREFGPVTLTHTEITRYFMSIPEAAQLVIQAGAMGKGGDVFVLDMGKPVKIKDLATKMIHLSGYQVKDEANPDGDIEIRCTGLRPGEKLYEELLIGENVSGTYHSRIMTANESMLEWTSLKPLLDSLDVACHNFDHKAIRNILLNAPAAFSPTDGICDLVWQAKITSNSTRPKVVPLVSN